MPAKVGADGVQGFYVGLFHLARHPLFWACEMKLAEPGLDKTLKAWSSDSLNRGYHAKRDSPVDVSRKRDQYSRIERLLLKYQQPLQHFKMLTLPGTEWAFENLLARRCHPKDRAFGKWREKFPAFIGVEKDTQIRRRFLTYLRESIIILP